MRKSLVLLGTFLLATLSATVQAQNFYVCDNGNDSNDGRSEASPFKSYEKAMDTFNKMDAGDSVLFCRGGVFPAVKQTRLGNWKCSVEKTCTFADYGNTSKPAPMILADGITALNFENGGDAKQDGGYHIKNLTLMGKSQSHSGIRFFNDVDDVIMENLHIEGFNGGVYTAGANAPEAGSGSNGTNDRLTLKNSTFINNKSVGFYGGCNDCLIENNHFENNGFGRRILDHNIYIGRVSSDPNHFVNNITIRNNTLLKSTHINGKCDGVSLVVHGRVRGLTIENNTIKEEVGKVTQYCWGIAIDPGYHNADESFVGLKIHNNKLFNVGNIGIGCSSCKDAVISDNIIIDEGDVLRTAIAVPTKPEDTLKSQNITISGNKIALNNDLAIGISLRGEYPFKAHNNEISLPENGSNTECIQREGVNSDTNISSNLCKYHNGISLNDITNGNEPETEVAENTPEIPVEEEPVINEPEPETEVVDNTPEVPVEEPVVTEPEPETEVVDNTPEVPVEEEPVVTEPEPETEVVENTPEVPVEEEPAVTEPEPETEVVDSGDNNETVTSFQRPSWAKQRPVGSGNFTMDSLKESMQNDYSNENASECRFFARGRCLIR